MRREHKLSGRHADRFEPRDGPFGAVCVWGGQAMGAGGAVRLALAFTSRAGGKAQR
jgi:hypothetical protein